MCESKYQCSLMTNLRSSFYVWIKVPMFLNDKTEISKASFHVWIKISMFLNDKSDHFQPLINHCSNRWLQTLVVCTTSGTQTEMFTALFLYFQQTSLPGWCGHEKQNKTKQNNDWRPNSWHRPQTDKHKGAVHLVLPSGPKHNPEINGMSWTQLNWIKVYSIFQRKSKKNHTSHEIMGNTVTLKLLHFHSNKKTDEKKFTKFVWRPVVMALRSKKHRSLMLIFQTQWTGRKKVQSGTDCTDLY